jgi:hypothetical protein
MAQFDVHRNTGNFKIRGTSVVLHPLEIVSIPVDKLGALVASLTDQSQQIVAALDELFTRAADGRKVPIVGRRSNLSNQPDVPGPSRGSAP